MVMAATAMTTAAVATAVVTTVATVMAVETGLEAALATDELSAMTVEAVVSCCVDEEEKAAL